MNASSKTESTFSAAERTERANWLPAPKGDFSLFIRAYWPQVPVTDGSWTPPPVIAA
jgi:hypothetical protein